MDRKFGQWLKMAALHPLLFERAKISKREEKWDETEMKRNSLNDKAMNALVYALKFDEFNQICNSEMDKEICDVFWKWLMKTQTKLKS